MHIQEVPSLISIIWLFGHAYSQATQYFQSERFGQNLVFPAAYENSFIEVLRFL
jgi:hypothetical protein